MVADGYPGFSRSGKLLEYLIFNEFFFKIQKSASGNQIDFYSILWEWYLRMDPKPKSG